MEVLCLPALPASKYPDGFWENLMNVPAGNYKVRRGAQEFGPYDNTTLGHYIDAGNVVLSDLVEVNGSGIWLPLSQVVAQQPAYGVAPNYPIASAPYGAQQPMGGYSNPMPVAGGVDLPPNLPWALMILLCIVPFFAIVWGFILANWAKKLNGNSVPLIAMIVTTICMLGYYGSLISTILGAAASSPGTAGASLGMSGLFSLGLIVSIIVANFSIRSSIESYYNSTENIRLSLSGVMTFFFNIIYFQYHVNRLWRWKQTGISM